MKYTKIIYPLFILIFFSLVIISKNYAEKKRDKISFLNNQITQLKKDRDNTAYRIGYIPFEFLNKKNFKLENLSFELKKYNTDLLNFTTGFGSIGSSYIDYYDNKLFFVTAKGVFSYGNFSDIEKEKFNLLTIKNNFSKIVNTDLFYKNGAYGIKDILIVDDEIFISFTDEIKKNCYNTSILQAKLNTEFLKFEYFFKAKNCINETIEDFFSPHQSGGRLVKFKDNSILFSNGEYRSRMLAQSIDNTNGKIISINRKTKKYKILALGLRNPQGLLYDQKKQKIYVSDHGPQGGDEINVISDLNTIPNFGWPISSYGEHYGHNKRDRSDTYKIAPLKKSHKEYGFEEPLKFFTPSIGISQIEILYNKFEKPVNNSLIVTSMGNKAEEGDLSIHLLTLKANKVIDHEVVNLDERIRDIIFIKEKNKYVLFLETSTSIGVIDLNNINK
tara:strand:- start:2407 stop:3741 length:1335 start_codon:yes stop_codon:yes gene_type:complete